MGGVPRGSFLLALWLLTLMRLAREEDIPYPRLFFFFSVFWERGYKRASIQTFLDGLHCERPNKKTDLSRHRASKALVSDGIAVDELTGFFPH